MSDPDILRLPYDDSLTRAGIEYAKKSLHYTYNRMALGPGARLRKIVAGIAVELALRRWLQGRGVPFDVRGQTPFTEKDRYDIRLGGRRCDVKSFVISEARQAAALRADPAAWLRKAEALVPADQLRSSSLDDEDFYVFAFLACRESRNYSDVMADEDAARPTCLLHTFTSAPWVGASPWATLGRLAFKSDGGQPLSLEVGGQDGSHAAQVERLDLQPLERAATQAEFYTLLYLQTARLPGAVLGVHAPAHQRTALIKPPHWHNVWIYGHEIFVAGWMTKADFRRRSRRLPAGSTVRQYRRTQTENGSVPVGSLRPMRELAELIIQHGRG